MKTAPLPKNEEARLKALSEYDILDTLPEEEYDYITKTASEICRTPISLVSLIDKDRYWFKSRQRLHVQEIPREHSFCPHAIRKPDELFIVPDTRKDERFAHSQLINRYPRLVFYAGVPLVDDSGFALGSLCVIDHRPRTLTDNQLLSLKALARLVISHLALRKKQKELEILRQEKQKAEEDKIKVLHFMKFKAQAPAQSIINSCDRVLYGEPRLDQMPHLTVIREAAKNLQQSIEELLRSRYGLHHDN